MIPLSHWFYASALLGSFAVLLGSWGMGLFFGGTILGGWAFVFYNSDRRWAFGIVSTVAVFGWGLWNLSLSVICPIEAPRRSQCKNHLKWIGIALHNYHEQYGSFPPAYNADANGKPLHSWRVLLLPYVDQMPLYEAFDLAKPWDSPENQKHQRKTPDIFACPSHYPYPQKVSSISYLAVTGPRTAWPGSTSAKFKDMKDGASNTILLIEHHSDIPWTEPRDLSLDEAVDVLASTDMETFAGHRRETFFAKDFFGRHVLFADGGVRFVPFGLDRSLVRELLTIDDEQPAKDWEMAIAGVEPVTRTRWDNVIRFAVAAFFTLLPLPWVWIHPTGIKKQAKMEQA